MDSSKAKHRRTHRHSRDRLGLAALASCSACSSSAALARARTAGNTNNSRGASPRRAHGTGLRGRRRRRPSLQMLAPCAILPRLSAPKTRATSSPSRRSRATVVVRPRPSADADADAPGRRSRSIGRARQRIPRTANSRSKYRRQVTRRRASSSKGSGADHFQRGAQLTAQVPATLIAAQGTRTVMCARPPTRATRTRRRSRDGPDSRSSPSSPIRRQASRATVRAQGEPGNDLLTVQRARAADSASRSSTLGSRSRVRGHASQEKSTPSRSRAKGGTPPRAGGAPPTPSAPRDEPYEPPRTVETRARASRRPGARVAAASRGVGRAEGERATRSSPCAP